MPVQFNDEKEEARLDDLRDQEAEELAQALSAKYGVQYVDLSRTPINTDALRLVPEELAREANAAAFSFSGEKVNVVAVSPVHPKLKEVIEAVKRAGYEEVTTYIGSPASVARAWGRYPEISTSFVTKAGEIDISAKQLTLFVDEIKNITDVNRLVKQSTSEKSTISIILEIILAGALRFDASDIHIEPEEGAVRIRFRLDGVLVQVTDIDAHTFKLISSRIKLVSALKLNIESARQDGRFSIKLPARGEAQKEKSMEVRTSVIPGAYGESIVLRILNPDTISVSLESLGMNDYLLEIIKKQLAKPNGMILTTGPTGSGKTTTLYAFLRKVNEPGIKIITIEDPIEYHLPGITQTQTDAKKGYTFGEGLKSTLRQDPDIIMVGEIRDAETAKTAVDAALTGHLVFSTLHTNNAAGAIPRLIDLEVNPKVIGPAVNIALAQRLIRKLCLKCKKKDAPNDTEKRSVQKILDDIKTRNIEVPAFSSIWRAVGCEACNEGYKGRIGIFEGVMIDEKVEEVITKDPSEYDIFRASEHQKILTMSQDGIVKVITGVTSLEELARVVSLDEE